MANEYRHILEYNGTYKTLDTSPLGWDELTISFIRHKIYGTVLRSDATSLRFLNVSEFDDEGGFYFITNIVNTYSPNAEINYILQKRNSDNWTYSNFYQGVLELNTDAGYNETLDWVEVKTVDSRKLERLISRDDNTVNVFTSTSIDGVTVNSLTNQNIEYTPIDIYLNVDPDGEFSGSDSISGNLLEFDTPISAVLIVNEMPERIEVNNPATDNIVYSNNLRYSSELQVLYMLGESNDTLNLSGISALNTWTYRKTFNLKSYNSDDIEIDSYSVIIDEVSGSGNQTNRQLIDSYSLSSTKLTVPAGGYARMYMSIFFNTGGATPSISIQSTTSVNTARIQEVTDGAPKSSVNGYLSHEYFTRITELLTSDVNQTNTLYSPILGRTNSQFRTYASDGELSKLFFTGGFQLRGMDKALNVQLSNSFISLNAMRPVGMWYDKSNSRFEIKAIEDYYQQSPFNFVVENVADFKKEFSKDYYWNILKGGYPKTDYEDFQGVNEFNQEIEYSSPFVSKNTYKAQSPYFGDSIGPETLRRLGRNSKDSREDENVYIHDTDGSTVKQCTGYTGFDGIEQYYNPGYTPRQNILKHTPLIGAQFHNLQSEPIRFQKATKDNNITYSGINEFDNIPYAQFLGSLIYPEIYTFNGYVTDDFINELNTNPHKYLIFTDIYGNEYKGFILKIDYNDYKGTAEFELIRANV